MAVFKCKMCGGTLEVQPGESVAVCDSCGTKQTLPRLDDERKANLYDRANHFRRNNDFDKAMGIYEQILNEDSTDAEAYWSIVLCRYGIEYVEDPATHKHIPTVNRAQFTSIYMDEDYRSAIKCSDRYQKSVYEEEAQSIDDIQRGILEISSKEEPFDVFISFKDMDTNGRRTRDAVLAQELYNELTKEGYKVFFAPVTLEDKLGTAYEPYIFAALNSSKVMVVLGTKPEHFNAVWVKNEWSRYLALIKSGASKTLIPAYKDMDPYDLPEQFSHLMAQDMSKLGFMQDLVRVIKKLSSKDQPKVVTNEYVVMNGTSNVNTVALLKRAFMFLEDGEFAKADDFCEQVLNIDPECAEAYLGKLMAELKVETKENLVNLTEAFDERNNYKKAIRFADKPLSDELQGYVSYIKANVDNILISETYNNAVSMMNCAATESNFLNAAAMFDIVHKYKDSKRLAELCRISAEKAAKKRKWIFAISAVIVVIAILVSIILAVVIPNSRYMSATVLMNDGKYDEAISSFKALNGYMDSEKQIELCEDAIKAKAIDDDYNAAVAMMEAGNINEAISAFEAINGYKDSDNLILQCRYFDAVETRNKGNSLVAAKLFESLGDFSDSRDQFQSIWGNITQRDTICAASKHAVGIKSDGTVVATGENEYGRCDVESWTDIIAVSAGSYHTVGLKSDGTVVATGNNKYGQCDVSGWADIVAVSAGGYHTVGLKSDGTVIATGYSGEGQCNVDNWAGIIVISAGSYHTVGLKLDGTVVATGYNGIGECNVDGWTDIVAVSASDFYTVGIKSDGTAVAIGYNFDGQCKVSSLTDAVSVSANKFHSVGLRADGTVAAAGNNIYGRCNVKDWKNIAVVSAGETFTLGLKSDGAVVLAGNPGYCDFSSWENMMLPNH